VSPPSDTIASAPHRLAYLYIEAQKRTKGRPVLSARSLCRVHALSTYERWANSATVWSARIGRIAERRCLGYGHESAYEAPLTYTSSLGECYLRWLRCARHDGKTECLDEERSDEAISKCYTAMENWYDRRARALIVGRV
jgi:hypothetical protein